MKLRDIATISTGFSFRSRLKHDPDGDTYVIQMGDVDPLYGVKFDQLVKIKLKGKHDRFLLQGNDILMVSKGNNLNAYSSDWMKDRIIAVNSLITIRIERSAYFPGYVTWYLNSPKVQHFIQQVAAGTGTPNLSKKILSEIDIPFIDPVNQSLISKIDVSRRRESVILAELQKKRNYLTEHTLQNAFEKMQKYEKPF